MKQMLAEGILPDLQRRAGFTGVIQSRTLRTWGQSESGLAEQLDAEIRRLDEVGGATIAFLASGWEGLKVRITAKADTEEQVAEILADEERIVREIVGDEIVGTDDDTMESVVLQLLRDQGKTLAVAESLTGGLIGSRLTGIAGSSDVFAAESRPMTVRSSSPPRVSRRAGGQRGDGASDGGAGLCRPWCRCRCGGHGRRRAGAARGQRPGRCSGSPPASMAWPRRTS